MHYFYFFIYCTVSCISYYNKVPIIRQYKFIVLIVKLSYIGPFLSDWYILFILNCKRVHDFEKNRTGLISEILLFVIFIQLKTNIWTKKVTSDVSNCKPKG